MSTANGRLADNSSGRVCGCHDHIPHVSHRSRLEPERDRALLVRPGLQLVDDQRWLLLVVYVQSGASIAYFDPDLRPRVGEEIDVRLVARWRLLAQSRPGPIGL